MYKQLSQKRAAILHAASFEPFATARLALTQKAKRGFKLQSATKLPH
jgi:hypothetical protein